jgi:hypothetical protein
MKRAISITIVFLLTCGTTVAIAKLVFADQIEIIPNQPALDQNAKNLRTVSYQGISFSFHPSLATEVKSETIPAMLSGKPSDIAPDHSAFTFIGYKLPRTLAQGDPQIRVFPIAKFRDAVRRASAENARTVVSPKKPPSWTIYFDEELRTLKALLAQRPGAKNLRRVIVRARRNASNSQLPFLPLWEATQAFAAHVRYVDFKNGKGVFFLTQWDPSDTTQVTNEGLEYAFQGITNDGQYHVYAEFAVKTAVLPRGDEPEVINWNKKNYLIEHQSRRYQNYLRPILAKLEALRADEFQPNLELLEELIGSLEVQNK